MKNVAPTVLATSLRRLMDGKLVKGKPITANELAKQSGVPQITITRILNGDVADPRTPQLQKLALTLDVTINNLRDGGASDAAMAPNFLGADHNLMYVSIDEIRLLTQYRLSNDLGKQQITALAKTIAQQSPASPLRTVSV